MALKSMNINKSFTLIEFIAVIIIVAMVAGMVIANFGRTPSNLLLEQIVARIDLLMKDASNRAVMQGKEIVLEYRSEERAFKIRKKQDDTYAEKIVSGKYSRYELPEDVVVEPVNYDEFYNREEIAEFTFFPDGAGSGSAFKVELKGHARILEISPLTGLMMVYDVE